MGHYVRILTPSESRVSIADLSSVLQTSLLRLEQGTPGQWERLILSHEDGREISLIERNQVFDGSLANEEIEEFISEIDDLKPASAARWLRSYLPQVKTIYALQVLNGVYDRNGWQEFGALKGRLWNELEGIFQADGEGFSNEHGHHILWQFSDGVKGLWWMAVLTHHGRWIHFQMELGDATQREQFLEGVVPAGVTLGT